MLDKDICIDRLATIKEVLKKLDASAAKVLLVVDKNLSLQGAITDGDIRRHILRGTSLDSDIGKIYNKKPVFVTQENFSLKDAKKILLARKIELLPIVEGRNRKVVNFITWKTAFSEVEKEKMVKRRQRNIGVPVVIMAGGKGIRLEPFTKILPKPLVPIGEKPVIEIIIDEFRKQGARDYFVTLDSRGKMIELYFSNNNSRDYTVNCVFERDGSLGTAGSLRLLKKELGKTFIVSNCDVIVKADFGEILRFHKKKKATLTIVSAIRHYSIPYGVIKFKEGGIVKNVEEKPEYTFSVNAGVYILDKNIFNYLPNKPSFDMTDVIRRLLDSKEKVVMYPVNEQNYVDIGQWEEYKKTVEKLQLFK